MDRQWHKLILLISLLLIPSICFAMPLWMVGGHPTDCPEGTYLFAWNGDYPSDTDKGCFTNGTVQKDGTQSGGTLTSTAFTKTAHDQYVRWVVTTNDGLNEDIGTVWILVNVTNDASRTMAFVFESYVTDYLGVYISSTNTVGGIYYGQGGTSQGVTTADTLTPGTDTWIAYTWDEANNVHCARIGAGSWRCDTETLTNWTNSPDDVTIGESVLKDVESDTVAIKEIYIFSGYQSGRL